MIRWVAEADELGAEDSGRCARCWTPRSARSWFPARAAEPRHRAIGPYELQDFNLYYLLRFGYAPSKVAFLA